MLSLSVWQPEISLQASEIMRGAVISLAVLGFVALFYAISYQSLFFFFCFLWAWQVKYLWSLASFKHDKSIVALSFKRGKWVLSTREGQELIAELVDCFSAPGFVVLHFKQSGQRNFFAFTPLNFTQIIFFDQVNDRDFRYLKAALRMQRKDFFKQTMFKEYI